MFGNYSESDCIGPVTNPKSVPERENQKEIERWKADEFPRIIREAWQRKAYVAFLDESGFFLTPLVQRTLAPCGK